MITDYVPSTTEELTDYSLVFYYEPGGGLSFPCDENGKVELDKMEEPAVRNYQSAMAHPEKYPVAWNKIEKRTRNCKVPASGTCTCGNRIELVDEYLGACQCPECGQWWNLFGQKLKPVQQWKDGDDW